MGKKLYDSDLLEMMEKEMETDYYTFGAYTDYDDLDVPNLKCFCGYAKDNETTEEP